MEKPAVNKPVAARRVLVVDDDPVIGKSFTAVLAAKGYAVITAASGEEAMKKLANETYDMVFTDIKMPGMSGIEVAQTLKKTRPWLPVVIVTGYGSQKAEQDADEAGVKEFLRKPLTPEMISDSAERVMAETRVEPAAPSAVQTVEVPEAVAVKRTSEEKLRDVAMFFASPLIGLMYFLALPFAGLGLVAWYTGDALEEKWELSNNPEMIMLRRIFVTIAAPLIGLVYVIVLPIGGCIFLVWYAWKWVVGKFK